MAGKGVREMKRIWIGIVLLASLLGIGFWISGFMDQAHSPVARDIRQAGELALEEQWSTAQAFAKRGQTQWKEKWPVTAAIADHEPMDEIDALFSQLDAYAKAEEEVAYSAVCAHLASLLEAISQSHSFNWWNLM